MSLQPVDGVLSAITKVASTSQMAASELMRFGLYEALNDQIDTQRLQLDYDALEEMEARNAMARRHLERRAVAKAYSGQDPEDDRVLDALDALDEYVRVEKGVLDAAARLIFNRKHPRDEQGRFVRADVTGSVNRNEQPDKRHTAHEREAHRYVNQWKSSGLINDKTPLMLHYRIVDQAGNEQGKDPMGPQRTTAETLEHNLAAYRAQDPNRMLEGISFDRANIPEKDPRRRAAMDALARFTGPDDVKFAGRVGQALPFDNDNKPVNQDQHARDWNKVSEPGDRRSFRRMKLTGQALSSVSEQGSFGDQLGGMAQLVGDLGPEAEKILGPGIRRTAYRYRGTERRPDKHLGAQVAAAQRNADAMHSVTEANFAQYEDKVRSWEVAAGDKKSKGGDDLAAAVSLYYAKHNTEMPDDQRELLMRGDTAVAYLVQDQRAIPNQKVARLSIKAGELPPSVGIMIDADGDVVSQAQGFNGDHYLPFDLKNLGRLQGGQYVRTRVTGGPTTEDIYTGLLTGARQIQVASNSGVFTLEFDPDVRGGRRYTDKARRMVERYAHLLDAVQNAGMYSVDIPEKEKADIRREAYKLARGNKARYDELYEQMLEQKRTEGALEALVPEEIDQAVESQTQTWVNQQSERPSPQQVAQFKADTQRKLVQQARAQAPRPMQLDGEGYYEALMALHQEFPYYIRNVDYQSLPEFLDERGLGNPQDRKVNFSRDRGYVRPGGTNPPGMPRGYYKPAFADEEKATTTTEQAREATRTGAGTGAAVETVVADVKNAKVRPVIDKDTVSLSQVVAPGGALATRLNGNLATVLAPVKALRSKNLIDELDNLEHEPSTTDEDVMGMDPSTYLIWAYRKHGGDNSARFAAWALTEATPEQAVVITQGLKALQDRMVQDVNNYETIMPGGEQAYAKAVANAQTLIGLRAPFAKASGDMAFAEPDMDNPRPQPFPEIVALGNKVDNYEAYLQTAKVDDPGFAPALQAINNHPGDEEAATLVLNAITAYQEEMEHPTDVGAPQRLADELEHLQRAWAFEKARTLAVDLAELGAGGGAAPKAPQRGVSAFDLNGEERETSTNGVGKRLLVPLRPRQDEVSKSLVEQYLEHHQRLNRV